MIGRQESFGADVDGGIQIKTRGPPLAEGFMESDNRQPDSSKLKKKVSKKGQSSHVVRDTGDSQPFGGAIIMGGGQG